MPQPPDLLTATKSIQVAAEWIETELTTHEAGTRRHAVLTLAWHDLMNAHTLLLKERLTPEDMVGAHEAAKQITSDAKP